MVLTQKFSRKDADQPYSGSERLDEQIDKAFDEEAITDLEESVEQLKEALEGYEALTRLYDDLIPSFVNAVDVAAEHQAVKHVQWLLWARGELGYGLLRESTVDGRTRFFPHGSAEHVHATDGFQGEEGSS